MKPDEIEQLINRAQEIMEAATTDDELISLDQVDFVDDITVSEVQIEVANIFLQNTQVVSFDACYHLRKIVDNADNIVDNADNMDYFPHPVFDPLMNSNNY